MSDQPFPSEFPSAYDEDVPPGLQGPQDAAFTSMQGMQFDQDDYINEVINGFNQQDPNIDPALAQHQPDQLTSHSTASSIYPPHTTSGATTTAATPYFSDTPATGLFDHQAFGQSFDVASRSDAREESRRPSKRVMSQGDFDARHAQGANLPSSSQDIYQQAAPVAPMLSNAPESSPQATRQGSEVTSSLLPPQNQLVLPQNHQRLDLHSELYVAANNTPLDMSSDRVPYQAGVGQIYSLPTSQQVRGRQHASQQVNSMAQGFRTQLVYAPRNLIEAGVPQQARPPVFPSGHVAFQAVARLAGSAFERPFFQNSTEPFVNGLFKPWDGVHNDPELDACRENSVPPTPPARPTDDDKLLCGNPDCKKVLSKNPQSTLCTGCRDKRKHEKRGPTVVEFDPFMTYAEAVDNVFSFRERHHQPQGSAEMLADFEQNASPQGRQAWAQNILRAMNHEYTLPGHTFKDNESRLIGTARVKAQAGYDLKFVQQREQYNYRMINSRVLLLLEAAIQYQAGNARTVYDDGGDNMGYTTNTELTLGARLEKICEILRDEKKIVLDIIEGRGVNAFVRDPNKYLQRKLDNIRSNDRKRQAKEDASGGPPKSGGSRKTQNARSRQAIRRQQEEAQRAGISEEVTIAKLPGRKRRAGSGSADNRQRHSSELMLSPALSDNQMVDYDNTGRVDAHAHPSANAFGSDNDQLMPDWITQHLPGFYTPPGPSPMVPQVVPSVPNALTQTATPFQASQRTDQEWRVRSAETSQRLQQQYNAQLADQRMRIAAAQQAGHQGSQIAGVALHATSQQTGQQPVNTQWQGFSSGFANNQSPFGHHSAGQRPGNEPSNTIDYTGQYPPQG